MERFERRSVFEVNACVIALALIFGFLTGYFSASILRPDYNIFGVFRLHSGQLVKCWVGDNGLPVCEEMGP